MDTVVNTIIDNPDLPVEFVRDLLILKSEKNPKLEPFVPELNKPTKPNKVP